MCHLISANLGIGVAPLAACRAQVGALRLKAIRLKDVWAARRLVMAPRANGALSPAADRAHDNVGATLKLIQLAIGDAISPASQCVVSVKVPAAGLSKRPSALRDA